MDPYFYLLPPSQDPHGELTGQNVLIVRGSLEKTAEEFKMEASQTKELLARCRETLYTERQKRPKPHRDDKILTAWNGQQFVHLKFVCVHTITLGVVIVYAVSRPFPQLSPLACNVILEWGWEGG